MSQKPGYERPWTTRELLFPEVTKVSDPGVCNCGAYEGRVHTKSARCDDFRAEPVPGSYTGIEPIDRQRIRELEAGLKNVIDHTGRGSVVYQVAVKALAGSKALQPECICPTCGLRHGGSNVDGGF